MLCGTREMFADLTLHLDGKFFVARPICFVQFSSRSAHCVRLVRFISVVLFTLKGNRVCFNQCLLWCQTSGVQIHSIWVLFMEVNLIE